IVLLVICVIAGGVLFVTGNLYSSDVFPVAADGTATSRWEVTSITLELNMLPAIVLALGIISGLLLVVLPSPFLNLVQDPRDLAHAPDCTSRLPPPVGSPKFNPQNPNHQIQFTSKARISKSHAKPSLSGEPSICPISFMTTGKKSICPDATAAA